MGYSTLRNIHIDTGIHSPRDISLAFATSYNSDAIGLYTYISKSTEPSGVLDFDGVCPRQWYNETVDLCQFSQLFPDATITVIGTGEESEDNWERRYRGGHCQERHRINVWGEWEDVM